VGELIPVGVQTVVLALRLGTSVIKVRDLVESEGSSPSWSVLVSGIREPEAEQLIQGFAEANVSKSSTFYLLETKKG
jgi:naphtho-gamma-pyrone polyketide synthase